MLLLFVVMMLALSARMANSGYAVTGLGYDALLNFGSTSPILSKPSFDAIVSPGYKRLPCVLGARTGDAFENSSSMAIILSW